MIEASNISKCFARENVLKDLSFSLEENHTLSVLGQSGSGKSTLLRILAGLTAADTGEFRIQGKDIMHLPPQKRGVVYISQEPLLFPNLSVYQNLSYGLEVRKADRKTIQKEVIRLAQALGVEAHLSKYPYQLSGGQRQRINFGRAIIISPGILLLDEPFGSLDYQTRREMQEFFMKLKKEFSITAIFVTHDIKEAILMGDSYSILENGQLIHFSTIGELAAYPKSGIKEEMEFWKNLKK